MNETLTRFSQRYQAALRRHLTPGSKASPGAPDSLGRRAVVLGLETLAVARVHEQAMASWRPVRESARSSEGRIRRARAFFAEVVAPLVQTHRAALKAGLHLKRVSRTLRQRSAESSASARHLKRGIRQRRQAEAALEKSGHQRTRLVEESRRLQQQSRHLTHNILSAQENEWQKISRQLHDEIAQILLGINVRLLALKQAARTNTGTLKKEIASTQRLVKQSVRTIQQFAYAFGFHVET